MLAFLQVIGGLIILFVGGELLVRGTVGLAKRLGISTFVIGLTIVAYGTSSPELIISIKAILDGYSGIALGNVVGSNISNILCVLGLSALIYPISIKKSVSGFDTYAMVGISLLFFALAFTGSYSLFSGILCLAVLSAYTFFLFHKSNREKNHQPELATQEVEEQIHVKLNLWQSALASIAGGGILMFGADLMIDGAVTISQNLGVSDAVVGVTIVAFGGSVPELATSVIAAFRKHSDIALANIIGSNIFNILGIVGITSLIGTIPVDEKFLYIDIPIMLVASLSLAFLVWKCSSINRLTGGIYLLCYCAYTTYQYI